jgi:hypothetical protein
MPAGVSLSRVSLCLWLAGSCCLLGGLLFMVVVTEQLQVGHVVIATCSKVDDVIHLIGSVVAALRLRLE